MSILKPTILIADDHPIVADSLKRLLELDFDIVGIVGAGEAALTQFQILRPDVVLLDVVMPPEDGFAIARQLKAISSDVCIIFVTMLTEPFHISEAFRVGAKGYVLKQTAPSDLRDAIRSVLRHEHYLSPEIAPEIRESVEYPWSKPGGFTTQLTHRQMQILELLARGKTARVIAEILKISTKTVTFHKSSIYRKLGVKTPTELTKFALTHGLASLE